MITWKVRGRRISHTPEPASAPMPEGQDDLHHSTFAWQARPASVGSRPRGGRGGFAPTGVRVAISISTVAPTTRENTPRSKRRALANGIAPIRGISA